MATQKKTLLELMVEAGIKWPDGAEYAAQDKEDSKVNFYRGGEPNFKAGGDIWWADNCFYMRGDGITLQSLCRNWHQTIVTREQYEAAVAEKASADGVANTEPQFFESITGFIPTKTIEQRISQLQVMERNAAEFRAKLTDDLHALGLTWREGAVVADEPKAEPEQPVITDWRDLLVGDVIWVEQMSSCGLPSGEYTISETDDSDTFPIALLHEGDSLWISLNGHRQWRFIRRP